MADLLHLSNSGYANIEKGENVLSVERLLDICKILGITSYNEVLPTINLHYTTEIEKVLLSGGMAFEQIHRNAMYVIHIIEDLSEKLKNSEQINLETTSSEINLILGYLKIISSESFKHNYNFLSIKNLIDKID